MKKRKLSKQTEKELRYGITKAKNLFEEANRRLATAIQNKDFTEMTVAQGLLEIAKNDLDKATVSMEKSKEQRSEIDHKRQKLIDSCMSRQRTTDAQSSSEK